MRTSFYLQGRAHLRPGPSNVTDEAEALRAIDEAGTIIGQERQFSVYTLTDVSESKVTAPFAARFTSSRRPTTPTSWLVPSSASPPSSRSSCEASSRSPVADSWPGTRAPRRWNGWRTRPGSFRASAERGAPTLVRRILAWRSSGPHANVLSPDLPIRSGR